MSDRETLFASTHRGTCDCCGGDDVPVMAFNDEYGSCVCEPCYTDGLAAMDALSDDERAELDRISEIARAHHA